MRRVIRLILSMSLTENTTQEAQERFKASQKELDELARSLENL